MGEEMIKSVDKFKEEAVKSGMPEKDAEEIKQSIEKANETKKRITEEEEKEEIEKARIKVGELFEEIKMVLKRYLKLKEEYYDVVAVWVIGTYNMDAFSTYPYLFINAQKGSGKTRMLKVLEVLVNKGILLASMREAVLFRLADKGFALLIDELEGLDRKENAPLRELLNACYKRGTKVFRMKKVGDKWDFDSFEPFTPIAIANIGGVDDVLGDRVITLILNKTTLTNFALLQEDMDKLAIIGKLKECDLCSLCSLCSKKYNRESFNQYVDELSTIHTTTLTTLTTLYTPSQRKTTLSSGVVSVYNRIVASKIRGRHLELMLPLLFVSLMLNEEVFDKVLEFGQELSKQKKEDDITDSLDVSLIDFVSKMRSELDYDRFRFVHKLAEEFRYFLGIRKEREQEDINSKWIGRALKRLGLIVDKRRLSAGVEVRLNVIKATKLLESIK
jgi:hypothetical protein